MAALVETRDVGSWMPLPAGVRRICCIGDSITYGQGVAPRQTLAAHVARFANIAYPDQLVWVDNRGQSSGNIWHSWAPFARLLEIVPYDAAILSLCQNDAQVFESNTVRYAREHESTWLRDGALAPLLQHTIADIAQTASRHDLCLLVDFYTRWERDMPLIEAVGQQCRKVGLPFVDLLQFLNTESGLSNAEYAASPFDGHPSDAGHQAAARRLVEELRLHWRPAPDTLPVADRLISACKQAMSAGWATEDVLQWALLVLDAKQTVSRRRRSKGMDATLGDLMAAREFVEQEYGRWYADCAARAQSLLLRRSQDELWKTLDSAYTAVRNLDEIAYVLQHGASAPIAAELWGLLEQADYYSVPGRLTHLPKDLRAQLLSIAAAVKAPTSAARTPFLSAAEVVGQDFERNLRLLASLLERDARMLAHDVGLHRLWQVAYNLVTSAWGYLQQNAEATAGTATTMPAKPLFFTTVDIHLERRRDRPGPGGVCNLTVQADYIEPLRPRRSEKLWASLDEESYVYRFELPLLLLGEIGLGVPVWDSAHKAFLAGDIRVSRVEIANSSADGAVRRQSFVWCPPADAPPVRWLTFKGMAATGNLEAETGGTPLSPPQEPGLLGRIRNLWSR